MEPSDAYYKAKRSFLFSVGCLFLAVFVGIKITADEQKITVLPISLAKPEFLPSIFAILVVFYLFQLSLQWAAQRAEVQVNRFHRIDFIATTSIGVVSLLCFGGEWLREHVQAISGFFASPVLSTVLALVGAALTIFLGWETLRAANIVGRYIKGTAAKDEETLSRLALSGGWFLHYNPDNPNAKKVIIFEKDGSIGAGRNQNEDSWRVKSGLLEILNNQNQVFSRFAYVPASDRFVHTNDPDTLSLRSQTISRTAQ